MIPMDGVTVARDVKTSSVGDGLGRGTYPILGDVCVVCVCVCVCVCVLLAVFGDAGSGAVV
jgi:hypothetical protein